MKPACAQSALETAKSNCRMSNYSSLDADFFFFSRRKDEWADRQLLQVAGASIDAAQPPSSPRVETLFIRKRSMALDGTLFD